MKEPLMSGRGKLDATLAAMFSNPLYASSYLFYAHMIGQCSIKIRDIPAPAGVSFINDHFVLYINKELFDEYDLRERLAILKHEMLHILYNHIERLENRDAKTWNIATDCAINQQIDSNDLPENCITPKTIHEHLNIDVPKNKSSEEYYELLKTEDMENHDHSTWEESTGDNDLKKTITKKMMESAAEQTMKSIGKIPKDYSSWLDINTVKSEVNWKKQLRNIIGNKKTNKKTTIKRFDRRFPRREDLRGKIKDRTFDLLLVADVSGSMSDDALIKTFSEVRNICSLTKTNLNMIQVDTKAHPPEKISKKTNVFNRKGNGGTELFDAINVANEHKLQYDAIVIITDGYIFDDDIENFLSINKKIIWLIEGDGLLSEKLSQGKMSAIKLDINI